MALNIGQVAKVTGVAAKTIRYYEEVGVLPSPYRTAAGYRQYTEDGVQQLLFIRRARALGLSLHHLRALTTALDGGRRGPVRPRVREVVRAHLSTVQGQISDLRLLERQLQQVLRRMRAPSRKRLGGRCRCLELSGAGTHSGQPAGSVHRR
jgi:MerR family copper efflux transcriptional regulator